MDRLVLEVVQFVLLIALAFGLHGVIRRSGEKYANEIFEANPRLGRAFLVLADIGFYLIFSAYTLFNVQLRGGRANAEQVQEVLYSVGGIALIIGILHVVNIVVLPFMAQLLGRRKGPQAGSANGRALEGRLGELLVTVTLNEAS